MLMSFLKFIWFSFSVFYSVWVLVCSLSSSQFNSRMVVNYRKSVNDCFGLNFCVYVFFYYGTTVYTWEYFMLYFLTGLTGKCLGLYYWGLFTCLHLYYWGLAGYLCLYGTYFGNKFYSLNWFIFLSCWGKFCYWEWEEI